MIKRVGKAIICTILERQVQRLRRQHTFVLIAVAGSVGKTSTKLAIADVLGATQAVRFQEGNYNDRLTVPLIFFGHELPGLFNVPAWLKIVRSNARQIRAAYPYEYVVVELGTDGPGQLQAFAYLQPDIALVTAVTPEHMEFFHDLDAVAAEELTVCDFARQVLLNIDDVPARYRQNLTYTGYGFAAQADYRLKSWRQRGIQGDQVHIEMPAASIKTHTPFIGRPGAKIALAAAAAAHLGGLTPDEISRGLERGRPFAGRMQILAGVRDTTLIDDTYNASPAAIEAALDVLYATRAPQRIAILGNMNELGDHSAAAHRGVGEYCDPAKLDWVVTIGPDAANYLAPAAANRGCQVRSFDNPYDAGEFVKGELKHGAVVLGEGSQNGVFAEEALKLLLKNPADARQLVRQSAYWLKRKRKSFKVNVKDHHGV